MKCTGCGFNTFDYLESCNKCGNVFESNLQFKKLYAKYSEPRKLKRNNKSDGLDPAGINKTNINLNRHKIIIPDDSKYTPSVKVSDNLNLHAQPSKSGLQGNEKEDIFEPDFKYDSSNIYLQASTESRIAASFIDFIILNILTLVCICCALLILGYKIDKSLLLIKEHVILIYLVLLFLSTSYFVLMQGFGGRTIGKLLLSLKVIKKDGIEIGFIDSFIRFIGYFISAVPVFLGFIWSYIDSNSQAWHDKIAGTVVIEK